MHTQTNSSGKANNGFTLIEILITLAVAGVLMAASAPLITQVFSSKTGMDKNSLSCINAYPNNPATPPAWYNTGTGVVKPLSDATFTADTNCLEAVKATQYDKGKTYNTVTYYANKGTAAQQATSKQILRAACDLGGNKACDYFINKCWKDGSTSPPYCDDTSSFADITYYLTLDSASYTNIGANYILSVVKGLVTKPVTNILLEVLVDGAAHPESLARDSQTAAGLITACNDGNAADCAAGYILGYNQSCNQIKTANPSAATGTYKLTYNDPTGATTVSVACDMTSAATGVNALASEAISGCDAATSVPDDCTYGYNHDINKGCNQIFTATSPTTGTVSHKLTSTGAGTPVSTSCTMTTGNISSASITGCNAGNANDCDYGYTNSKNRSCDQVASTWSAYIQGDDYNITSSTSAWASSECPAGPPDPACGATTIGSIKVSNCHNTDPAHTYANGVNGNPGGPACWYGLGNNGAGAGMCTGTGCGNYVTTIGGVPQYDKYLCNHAGAVNACAALGAGWRLPTNAEMQAWRVTPASTSALITTSPVSNLGLCDANLGVCSTYNGCIGSDGNNCYPAYLWSLDTSGSSIYYFTLSNGNWTLQPPYTPTWAGGTRCVMTL